MTTFSLSNCFFASRNSDASVVQPEVLAFGKKNSSTRLPRKSVSDTSFPSSAFTLKSGALSPAFSILNHLGLLGVRRACVTLGLERRRVYDTSNYQPL